MMTDWYENTIKALQLNGKGERTQPSAYTRAVRMLSQFYGKTPDQITEEELQDYFLHRKNVNKWSPNTMRICYCGIRFFFENVLQRNWHILGILRAQTERRLPAVSASKRCEASWPASKPSRTMPIFPIIGQQKIRWCSPV